MKNPDELLKQLRIGNYLNHQESECVEICSIQQDNTVRYNWHGENYGCYHIKQFTPIPLTEEWLIKLGFDNPIMSYIYSKGMISVNVGNHFTITVYAKTIRQIDNHFVHTLQNLYFAIEQEELTITP